MSGNSSATTVSASTAGSVFVTHPYDREINPGTADGYKLYKNATEKLGESEKLTLNQQNAKAILDQLENDSDTFRWGALIHKIITGTDATGVERKFSLLRNPNKAKLDDVMKQANKNWHDKTATHLTDIPEVASRTVQDINPQNDANDRKIFHTRARCNMIAYRVFGYFTAASVKKLTQYKHNYQWINSQGQSEFDGPTVVWYIIHIVKPTTVVGVSQYKTLIGQARLPAFNHNVRDMLTKMEQDYQHIIMEGQKHEDYLLHIFNALGSSKNDEFRTYIAGLKRDWESGEKEFTPDSLSCKALRVYNNMVSNNEWNSQDPKDTKIMALTTSVTKLEQQLKDKTALTTNTKSGGGGSVQIEDWRKKKGSATKLVDGKTYYWCPKHVRDGDYNGLYVCSHKPKEHDEWAQDKKGFSKA